MAEVQPSFEARTGIVTSADGSKNDLRSERTGALVIADGHGRYAEASRQGNVYFLSYPATAVPTAYVGAAGGTPLLGLHNPTGSGKILVLLAASALVRIAGSGGTPQTDVCLWAGASVVPTGTVTMPRNTSTFAQGGSGLGFINTAMTGSTALNLVLALAGYYWATGAGAFQSQGFFDLGGIVSLQPGMQAALGATVLPTSMTIDVSLFWEEMPL